jgi:hypothetical protein
MAEKMMATTLDFMITNRWKVLASFGDKGSSLSIVEGRAARDCLVEALRAAGSREIRCVPYHEPRPVGMWRRGSTGVG